MKKYLTESARTASNPEGVSFANFKNQLEALQSSATLVRAGITADCVKRSLFYREPKEKVDARYIKDMGTFGEMLIKMRDLEINFTEQELNLLHGVLGIVSEGSEIINELIESKIEGRPINLDAGKNSVKEEIGDVLWYVALVIREIKGETFESIGETNLAKLKARYPEKFESEQALNRDLDKEDEVLKS